jgi:hypothetical protein
MKGMNKLIPIPSAREEKTPNVMMAGIAQGYERRSGNSVLTTLNFLIT